MSPNLGGTSGRIGSSMITGGFKVDLAENVPENSSGNYCVLACHKWRERTMSEVFLL